MVRLSPEAVRAFGGRFLIALALSTLVTTAAVAGVNNEIDSRLTKIHRIHLIVAKPPPAGENFLIIGSDSRQFVDTPEDIAAFGKETGKNSDTLMVAHVEPGARRTLVVSFPRDLMVDVPGLSGKNRINAAYGTGGPQAVIEMLHQDFDIDIHHYVEVDFKSFQDVVDAIGAVKVYVPGHVRDVETGLDIAGGAGCYALDGGRALQYVRSRTMEIADPNGTIVDPDTGDRWRLLDVRADLDRIPRQQAFIRKLAAVAIDKSLSDPFTAVEIADNVLGDIKADQTLSRGDVNSLIGAFRTVDVNDSSAIQFETIPTAPDPSNPNATLVLGDGAQVMIDRLRTFGDNTPPTPSVLPAQVKVEVRDSTGKGIARDTLTKLVQLGFQSGGYRDVVKGAILSEIRYPPDHLAAAKTVLSYIPGASLVKDAGVSDGVVVVLGSIFPGITVDPTATTLPPIPVQPAPAATDTTAPRATTTTTLPASQECS
jgi:LCP family protein required for cell wall assembly